MFLHRTPLRYAVVLIIFLLILTGKINFCLEEWKDLVPIFVTYEEDTFQSNLFSVNILYKL